MKVDFCRLSEMAPKQQGTIVGLNVGQPLRSRMLGMGISKGANILVQRTSWFGHTFHITVDQLTNLIIRKIDANDIWVRVEMHVDSNSK